MRHVRLTTDLTGILGNDLRKGPCRIFTPLFLLIVRESGSIFHPDGVIACPPNWHSREIGAIDNPTVLFEATTPQSEVRDRGERFEHYAFLPSLRHYVLISTEARRADVYSRIEGEEWTLTTYAGSESVPLPAAGTELSLNDLYKDSGVEP